MEFFFILDVLISSRNKTKRTIEPNFYIEANVALKGNFKLDNILPFFPQFFFPQFLSAIYRHPVQSQWKC